MVLIGYKLKDSQAGLTCPVMIGVLVDRDEAERKGLIREFEGKKYYFCCDSC